MQQTEPSATRLRSATGRWVLITTVLGSGIAFLDSTVVTVALPTIGRELHAGLTDLQWTVTAYMLTLSAVMLVGGSLGDRYGRRLLFVVGVVWFTLASVACAIAPNAPVLVAARAVQGIGGALLTPASLAIIEGTFHGDDRGAAIGAWAGLGGLFGAAGPILGGALVLVSWRLIFFINVPIAVVAVLIAQRYVPETRSPRRRGRLDVPGPVLAVLGLGALTYALIQGPVDGWGSPAIVAAFIAGGVLLVALAINELRQPDPMLPLGVFRSRQFSGANGATFVVYAALGAVTFLLVVYLQQVGGYSPLTAGAALLPVTRPP